MSAEEAKEKARERAARIQKTVPILDLLIHYGYAVHPDAGDREQQFSCDLHGDGTDNKPSARVYPDSGSWFCFACDKARDAIGTVQDKEEVSFSEACHKLEEMWDLPHPSNWGEDWKPRPKVEPDDLVRLNTSVTFEDERSQTEKVLLYLTSDRVLKMPLCLQLWELFDQVCWSVHKEEWTEDKGKASLAKLRGKALDLGTKALREAS